MTTAPIPPVDGPAPERPILAAEPSPAPPSDGLTPQQRTTLIVTAIVALVLLGLLIWGAVVLIQNPTQAAAVRDVFIILMSLMMVFIGVALAVVAVQIALLTNLLRNELKPILEATQETVRTVRGTAVFLSENVAEPVIKLNAYVAGLSRIVDTLNQLGGIFRR
ncbi:MAG TPA: hypothetical protein PLC98_18935 [Anaerolineales bacterium]|nr:hypothetical protein [Anaerolineales bacterium]